MQIKDLKKAGWFLSGDRAAGEGKGGGRGGVRLSPSALTCSESVRSGACNGQMLRHGALEVTV